MDLPLGEVEDRRMLAVIWFAVWGAATPVQPPEHPDFPSSTREHQSIVYSTAACIYRLRIEAASKNVRSGKAAGTVRGRIFSEDWSATVKAMKAAQSRIVRKAKRNNIRLQSCTSPPILDLAKCGSLVYPDLSCTPEQESVFGDDINDLLESTAEAEPQ